SGSNHSPSEGPDYVCRHSHSGKDLYRLADVLEMPGARNFVRNINGVSWLKRNMGDVPRPPFARASTHYGAIGPDHENILLVSHAGGPARLFQIPAGTLSLAVSNGRRVINLAGNHHEVGPLGDHQAVAGANLNIHRRVLPFLNRCADVDKQAPTGRKLPGLVDE